jgi:hypothetical protein
MLAHHAHRPLANFLGIRLLCHGSIFSRLGASDEAGAVQLHQLYPQIIAIHDGDTIQRVLERTKEPFDPAVLPRAVQVGGLQSDAQHAKRHFHQPRVETRFIVHAKGARQAEASKAGQQAPQIYKYPTDSIYQIPPPNYASVGGNALGGSAGVAVNLHNGQMYGSGGGSVPVEAGAEFVFGWILNGGSDALDPGKTTNNFLSGTGASGAGCYFICVGLNHSFGGATAIEIGWGLGVKNKVSGSGGTGITVPIPGTSSNSKQ